MLSEAKKSKYIQNVSYRLHAKVLILAIWEPRQPEAQTCNSECNKHSLVKTQSSGNTLAAHLPISKHKFKTLVSQLSDTLLGLIIFRLLVIQTNVQPK